MNRQSFTLRRGWHIPTVFVMTIAVASPFLSIVLPHASKLRSNGHSEVAAYFTILGAAFWIVGFSILLPRTGNTSTSCVVRALGRVPLLIRWFLAAGVGLALFALGLLYERITG
jgi:hypothetical protein